MAEAGKFFKFTSLKVGDAVKKIVEKKSEIEFHLVSPFVETERVLTDHCVHCVRL